MSLEVPLECMLGQRASAGVDCRATVFYLLSRLCAATLKAPIIPSIHQICCDSRANLQVRWRKVEADMTGAEEDQAIIEVDPAKMRC